MTDAIPTPPANRPGRAQGLVSLAVLAVLAAVALGVWLKQQNYDPLAWGIPAPVKGQAAKAAAPGGPLDLNAFNVPGLIPMGPAEAFDPDSLSDKINGKAELYLAAGFKALATRRWQMAADPKLWFETYLFQMSEPLAAFSVFSTQRRGEAQPLDLTPNAYAASNAVFLAHGPYYLEIIASAPSAEAVRAAADWARALLALVPAAEARLSERDLFPAQDMDPESFALLASDVFGFDRLHQVFVAAYRLGQEEATAFLARRASGEEASDLAAAYVEFLLANGGALAEAPAQPEGARLIDVVGSWELVFTQGPFLAGVHQADSRQAAEELGRRLADSLGRAKP